MAESGFFDPSFFDPEFFHTGILKGNGVFTRLSVYGIPGQPQVFLVKSRAVSPVTQLTVAGIPGQRYRAFLPKSKGSGDFTRLTVYGIPGRVQVFTPKDAPGGFFDPAFFDPGFFHTG